ncbi:hypothetical protein J7T55_011986 [Diaporthe amygdali]|uniref:uncharacterized protein n=1 Tax=Phomopsis amygdali TaxID=1214568 RepID=UPI0022FF4086|nr:uncharacterized protein J7T55_011986 [Diaporthe amygdali]KAJ0123521.1 hypothetical protein J7T55_011986 [Diaporthe amygdali]
MASSPQIQKLMQLLEQETEAHRFTKSLLLQSQTCQQSWERAFRIAQAEIQCNQIKLSALETRVQQLTTENGRLNMVVGHLAPGRLHTSASSENINHGEINQPHAQDLSLDDPSSNPGQSKVSPFWNTRGRKEAAQARTVAGHQRRSPPPA